MEHISWELNSNLRYPWLCEDRARASQIEATLMRFEPVTSRLQRMVRMTLTTAPVTA